jgi:hypothetical protein
MLRSRTLLTLMIILIVKKNHFVFVYESIWEKSLSLVIIKSGWQATGIEPFNLEKALNFKSTPNSGC